MNTRMRSAAMGAAAPAWAVGISLVLYVLFEHTAELVQLVALVNSGTARP